MCSICGSCSSSLAQPHLGCLLVPANSKPHLERLVAARARLDHKEQAGRAEVTNTSALCTGFEFADGGVSQWFGHRFSLFAQAAVHPELSVRDAYAVGRNCSLRQRVHRAVRYATLWFVHNVGAPTPDYYRLSER
jgi:hypothetical protein